MQYDPYMESLGVKGLSVAYEMRTLSLFITASSLYLLRWTLHNRGDFSETQNLSSSLSHFQFITTAPSGVQNNERLATL